MPKTESVIGDLRLLPRVRECHALGGACHVDAGALLRAANEAAETPPLPTHAWTQEAGVPIEVTNDEGARVHTFQLGATPPDTPDVPPHPEAYVLALERDGIAARANTRIGLIHAWQTLKQILRADPTPPPCLRIRDWPDLAWRVYHVDLKGTRRTLDNLHALLPTLAEFKINAILAEYENAVQLDRHPDLAVPNAMTQAEVAAWVQAARDYGIEVIPLVQTLGHLHDVLNKPAYAELREHPDDPAEACPTHPGTWPLIRDLLDELMTLHPQAPFIHVGLDETFHIGSCPRCRARLDGGPAMRLYVEWANRVCRYVAERGFTPIVWGDRVAGALETALAAGLTKEALYVAWGYEETSAVHPFTRSSRGPCVSREWLQRPDGDMADLPRLGFRPGQPLLEDLPPAEQRDLTPLLDNPEFPQQLKTDVHLARFAAHGLRTAAVSGIRVSFHGCVAPKFMTGQLNTIMWADACREHEAEMLIGSSWSRGHSLAGLNAHPELDWYGAATLADAGWSRLETSRLRNFDRRFAFQFFGLPDGRIGDLYYLFERTSPRADHVMDNYLSCIADACAALRPQARRNHARLELLATAVDVQALRLRAQFVLLEIEYFFALGNRIPVALRTRINSDARTVASDIQKTMSALESRYAETLIQDDAVELANTQLGFLLHQLRTGAHPTPL